MAKFEIVEDMHCYRKLVYEAEDKWEAIHKWEMGEDAIEGDLEPEIDFDGAILYRVKELIENGRDH